jgi:hypothetical protein
MQENLQLRQSVSRPRFELRTSRMRISSATRSVTKFVVSMHTSFGPSELQNVFHLITSGEPCRYTIPLSFREVGSLGCPLLTFAS